jgi:hypothetical protein
VASLTQSRSTSLNEKAIDSAPTVKVIESPTVTAAPT